MSNKYRDLISTFMYGADTLPPNFLKFNDREKKRMKRDAAECLEEQRKGRKFVIIGVSQNFAFKDGTTGGQLIQGVAYRVTWEEYAALKLDGIRSFYTLLLEQKKDILRASVEQAIKVMVHLNQRST